MQVLALDFDGVISDSAPEAFAVSIRTCHEIEPDFPLRETDPEVYARFLDLMPLGNRAEDYRVILEAIARGVELADQAAYDRFRDALDAEALRAFHRRFYRVRHAWAEADPQGWLAKMAPYAAFCDILRRRGAETTLAVATAKDRRSVARLLAAYGIDDLFAPELVLDKETGVSKRAHIEHLCRVLRVEAAHVTFVDDKVNHLDAVAPLGSRCVLAGWGYNGERERREARARGHWICDLDDFEARVFGPAA